MAELVALHTQALTGAPAMRYLEVLRKTVRAARLSKQFPDRRALEGTLRSLAAGLQHELYDTVFVDARSGLPNMASLTRVLADQGVARDALPHMKTQADLDARRDQAEVYERLARKRPYFEGLLETTLLPVDEHRVLLRRHEPAQARASFRVELSKLGGDGTYLQVVIELTQTSGLWSHKLVQLDHRGEVAEGTEALRGMVYRFATFDSEALFLRLHELDGVTVERVARGVIGPLLWRMDDASPLEASASALRDAVAAAGDGPAIVGGFATDVAAIDVRDEKSNDPLSPLMRTTIKNQEMARYVAARERFPFRVYKDRKFVASQELAAAVRTLCDGAGTKNIVYPLR